MSSCRGRANHSLYLAKIQLQAWQRELGAEEVPATVLDQAFLPAVKAHLVAAYGWFLLEISQPVPLPDVPPAGCSQLPGVIEGKATSGELRECQGLEQDGWLADLLAASAQGVAVSRTSSNLAASHTAQVGPAEMAQWAQQLQALFDRMGDSLDEY